MLALAACLLSVTAFAACDSSEQSESVEIAIPTSTLPYAPLDATATPDLSQALSPKDARQELSEMSLVAPILDAVDERNADSLLSLIAWQPQKCGSVHGATDICPEGSAPGTELEMVNVSETVQFWLTADTLRPHLAELLASPLEIAFAGWTGSSSYSRASRAGKVFFLGLEGPPRSVSPSAMWADDTTRTGLFLVLDPASAPPIQALFPLDEQFSALDAAAFIGGGFQDYARIIVWNPQE